MAVHFYKNAGKIQTLTRKMPGDGIEPPTRGFSVLFSLLYNYLKLLNMPQPIDIKRFSSISYGLLIPYGSINYE